MFEKFTSANAGDFRQRYQGTYGFYKVTGKPRLLVLLEFVEGTVVFRDRSGVDYTLNADHGDDKGFEFLPPKSGFFNIHDGAYYVQRKAARQFQRGISNRNVDILRVVNDDSGGGFQIKAVNFAVLEHIYDKTVEYKTAWGNFVDGKVPSVAISPQIALSKTQVLVLGNFVGKVIKYSKDALTVCLEEKDLFRTEINDACRNLNVKVDFL